MKRTHLLGLVALATAASVALVGCGADPTDPTESQSADSPPSGDITVLTNRTDLVESTFPGYVTEFQKLYPMVNVNFEASTDYEGETKARLESQDYGDVLLIPSTSVSQNQYPEYFEPLGSTEELGTNYLFINDGSYDGTVYGLSTFGSAMGYVFNREVWTQAGITTPPTTEAEYLAALEAIKDTTGSIPYYTNYADGWPLDGLAGNIGTILGDGAQNAMTADPAPWTAGTDIYAIDSLLYNTVAAGLSEEDPTTTSWEQSKALLASGEISSMVLGSWAVSQMQNAAVAAGKSPDTIGFWPMPWAWEGAFSSVITTDYMLAINKHSENKQAARAWIDWFLADSGFAASQGALSSVRTAPSPDTLSDFTMLGVAYVELAPASPGEEGLIDAIAANSGVTLFGHDYRQQLIDTARGALEGDQNSFFADLNARWAQGMASSQ